MLGFSTVVYLPNSVEKVTLQYGGIPIIASESDALSFLQITNPADWGTNLLSSFFNSLSNAENISTIYLTRTSNIGLTSLSDVISKSLDNVTELRLTGYTSSNRQHLLSDLNGLEYFPNLETLVINYTSSSLDISGISSCGKIETIDIENCYVNDLSGLENLTSLVTLTLNDNNISDLSSLAELTMLTKLNLKNNVIYTDDNIQVLIDLYNSGNLRTLYLSGNGGLNTEGDAYKTLIGLDWTDSDF